MADLRPSGLGSGFHQHRAPGGQAVVGLRGEGLGAPCREEQPHSVNGHTLFDDWHLPCTTGLVLPLPLTVPGAGALLLPPRAPRCVSRGASRAFLSQPPPGTWWLVWPLRMASSPP